MDGHLVPGGWDYKSCPKNPSPLPMEAPLARPPMETPRKRTSGGNLTPWDIREIAEILRVDSHRKPIENFAKLLVNMSRLLHKTSLFEESMEALRTQENFCLAFGGKPRLPEPACHQFGLFGTMENGAGPFRAPGRAWSCSSNSVRITWPSRMYRHSTLYTRHLQRHTGAGILASSSAEA